MPTPGSPYNISISGLKPNSTFSLLLDGNDVLDGTLDGTGSINTSFIFPADMSNSDMHFLTAQDSTGEFAYDITCPVPEPGTIVLLAAAMIGLLSCMRHRCRSATWAVVVAGDQGKSIF